MLAADLKGLQEAYNQIYEQNDLITDALIEEVVEELVLEFVEEGYTLDDAVEIVEESALEYFDEATVTYGSDTESPEQRRERAKNKVGEKKSKARKAAVKGAVERVKTTAKGARAAAGIAGSIAKDEARRAGRSVQHKAGKAAQAVKDAPGKAKEAVKSGIKKLVGRGLRKVEKGAGYLAQKARKAGSAVGKAAERLGEDYIDENVMSGPVMKSGSGLGGAKPVYPADKAPKATGAKLPTLQKAGYELEGESLRESGLFSEEEIAAILEASEGIEEARRADKEGHSRGTAANPSRKDVPHSDPSQRSMLHSRIKSRSDQMGRDRRGSERNQSGGRTPVSNKEKSFLKAKDRTARSVRNPNVPDTGSHTEWPSQRRKQKDPKQNPKHNANK